MNRDELISILHGNICSVRFTKVDGTVRDMKCTLKSDLVPVPDHKPESNRVVNESVLPVWDLEKEQWRSFRVDSVVEIQPHLL